MFNIKCDLTLSDVECIRFGNRTCQSCQTYIFIDFKKIFALIRIRKLYHELFLIEKKNKITILIINQLPKNTKISGEIVPENDADLNLFCDVNIFGYFPTTIRLYPEDKPLMTF